MNNEEQNRSMVPNEVLADLAVCPLVTNRKFEADESRPSRQPVGLLDHDGDHFRRGAPLIG